MMIPPFPRVAVAVFAALMCAAAPAQQTPITGQMLAPTVPSPGTSADGAPSPASPAPPTPASTETTGSITQVGDTTRQLLRIQAQGTRAGKHLPIPGQEASASYQRYLKSFEHPIPEFYETAVSKSGGDSTGSAGAP